MTRIIAVINHKGGVGKTTTVATLGAALAEMGRRVLLVDLDAQCNLTTSVYNGTPERTIYDAFSEEYQLPIIPFKGSKSWALVPSSLDLAGTELEIASRMGREYILKDLLVPVREDYDYILLDCPPSLGLLTINALVAATEVVIPLTPEGLPATGLRRILDMVEKAKLRLNPSLTLSGILLTRWETSNLAKMVEESLRGKFPEVYKTKIRKNVRIAEAPLAHSNLLDYAPDSNGSEDYRNLAKEVDAQNR